MEVIANFKKYEAYINKYNITLEELFEKLSI